MIKPSWSGILKVVIIFVLYCIGGLTSNVWAQGATCDASEPYCTGSFTYAASTNSGTAQTGPNYGCLLTQVNPKWMHLKMGSSGNLDLEISNSGSEDIDFILWGPFADPIGACDSLLTGGNTVDCSYSTTAVEQANIVGAVSGENYILMITNFSNNPTNITITTLGTSTGSLTNSAEVDSISYPASACNIAGDSLAPQVYGTKFGKFSATPAGLSIDSITGIIDLGASTAGTYTVKFFVGQPLPSVCNDSATRVVVIEDVSTPPTITTCPGNQAGTMTPACTFSLPDYTGGAAATDPCETVTLTQSPTAGSIITTDTVVTIIATDQSGFSSTCNFTLTLQDTTSISITCPANQNVVFNGSCQYTLTDYTGLAGTVDPCASAITITQSPVSGTVITGTTTITLTANDGNGNSGMCTFDVIPSDTTSPTITCPGNQNVAFNGSCQFSLPDYTGMATTSDNCASSVTVTQSPVTGTLISTTTTITLTADDGNGNTSSCTFDVIPADTTSPVITCPGNQNAYYDGSCQFTLADYTGMATTSDNCASSITVTQSPVSGTVLTTTTTVTLTADDGNGQTSSCTFDVIPADTTSPSITCPGNQSANFDNACQFALADYTGMATTSDNCASSITVSQSPPIGTMLSSTITVTLTANDGNGNTSSCTFDVIPSDTTSPTITCPGNQNVAFDASCQHTLADYTGLATTSDNCASSITVTQNPLSGTVITTTTTITLTANDGNGNTSTCTFDVIPSDTTSPSITCPGNQNVIFDASCQFTLVDYTGLATTGDNCASSITVSQSPLSGTVITGTTTITLTANDGNGNTRSCTFDVIPSDTTSPSITCPGNQNVAFDASCQFTLVDYTGLATAGDNCASTITISQSPISGTVITTTTTVTLTANDGNGNTNTCVFDVIPSDTTSPSITCPGNQSVAFDGSCQYTMVDYTGLATTADNCAASITISQSPVVGTVITSTTTVTLTANDGNGNSNTCTFDVIPSDTTSPSIMCPGNQTGTYNGSCQFLLPDYTGLAATSDNCASSVTVIQTPISGTLIGSNTTITLTANDGNGNTSVCNFDVILSDTTSPNISCPGNQNVAFDGTCQFTLLDYTALAGTTDNCASVITVSQSPVSGTVITSTTTITLTANDGNGNVSTCSFDVIPSDTTSPSITCPGNQNVVFDAGCQFILLDYTGLATTSDNCASAVTITQSPLSGTVITSTTTISLTANDGNGNTNTCVFDVIPSDTTSPSITCPGNLNVAFDGSCQFTLPDYTGLATTSDNCASAIIITQSPISGTVITSTTAITLIANDGNGNTNSCTFNVIPSDTTSPVISCPGNQNVAFDGSCQFTLPDYTGLATTSDNCASSITITQSPAIGTGIASTTTITLTANDGNGNTSTCSFDVIPADTTSTGITCPGNQNVAFDASCQFTLLDYTSLATTTDNCASTITVTQNPISGTVLSATTTVTLTANDGNGNTNTCTFNVIPSDTTSPSITCPGNQNAAFDASCQFTLPDYTGLAVTSDNCASVITVTQSPSIGTVITSTTTITLTANDGNGNTSTCTLDVVPSDTTSPTITCPGNQNVAFDGSCQFTLPDYTGMAVTADNCASAISVAQSPVSGTVITSTTTITLTANDGNGNLSTCTFDVIPTDTTSPSIICPANQNVAFDASCQFTLPDYTGLATTADNCASTISVTQSPVSGTVITSTATITLTANDGNGNTNSCTFDVIPSDTTSPAITCPGNQSVVYDGSCQFILPDYTGLATTSDNCASSILVSQSPVAGSIISSTSTITLTANDGNGNTSSCTFDVIPVDTTSPFITCPGNQNVAFDGACQYTIIDFTSLATTSDNCASSVSITQSPAVGTIITATATVTLTANDGNGNMNTCTFSVIPSDTTSPAITCPTDQSVSFSANCDFTLPDYTGLAAATDNCATTITISQIPVIGSVITGTTLITLTADDGNGNTKSCTFNVIPADNTPPVAWCKDTTLYLDVNGNASILSSDLDSASTDNCGPLTFSASQLDFNCSDLGTNLVALTVEDGNTNTAVCTSTVVVLDTMSPVINCPGDLNVNFDANCQYEVPDFVTTLVTQDNCGVQNVTQSIAAGTFITASTSITMTATDGSGNNSSCSFVINITDNTPPVVTCPGDDLRYYDGSCEVTVPDYIPNVSASDNCGTVNLVQLPAAGTIVDENTQIIITAEDASGNSANCQFTLMVSDTTSPTMDCLSNQVLTLDLNCEARLPDYGELMNITDNCGSGLSYEQRPDIGTFYDQPELVEVLVTARDASGNESTCLFEVAIEPNEFNEACLDQVVISDLFTPNNDGKNDTWTIHELEYIKGCQVIVYSRWGVKVFESNNYNNDWDGTYNGSDLPDGSYYYIIQCDGVVKYKGAVSLLRMKKG